jgi:hypothetical protein
VITDTGRLHRSLVRLAEELGDHGIPISPDDEKLLQEAHYARFPRVHEREAPHYGAFILPPRTTFDDLASSLENGAFGTGRLIPIAELPLSAARRFADGRASFLVRAQDDGTALACFEHSVQFEASLVGIRGRTAVDIVQRTVNGVVKLYLSDHIAIWDRSRWHTKPYAAQVVPVLRRVVDGGDPTLLERLLELCFHWLSPGPHGATIVWSLETAPEELDHVDRSSEQPVPDLNVGCPEHFSALLSALSQTDGATLVGPEGDVVGLADTLLFDDEASSLVPAAVGTRHSSARWFSYEHPATLVIVVSEDGPVSVYCNGARIALDRLDVRPPHEEPRWEEDLRRCEHCDHVSLIDLAPPDEAEGSTTLTCAVCGASLGEAPQGSVVRGAPTTG